MLKTAGYQLPRQVHIHGFLMVDGEKMSKSKGTLPARRPFLLKHISPAYLRVVFTSRSSDTRASTIWT